MHHSLRDLFVDRSQHTNAFRRMLDGRAKRCVMVLEAGPGMGKSWLLHIFAHEAKERNLPLIQINFADRQKYDSLKFVHCCCGAFGVEHFNAVTNVINDVTTPRVELSVPKTTPSGAVNVSVGSENVLTSSTISVSDVGNTIFRDNFFTLQTTDPLARQAIEDRINAAFFDCLALLSTQSKVIFLFDSYERTSLKPDRWLSQTADQWIRYQLLHRIRKGELQNVIVVLAGRRVPTFDAEWNDVLGHKALNSFACADVIEYLRERRGLALISTSEAERLFQAIAGSPQLLGLIGDNLEQANTSPIQDEEW